MKKTITLPAYAKINLFLDITGTLPNGYHSLNNIMQQISLCDTVHISFEEYGDGSGEFQTNRTENIIEISCDNSQIPCNEKNIAYKAAALFLKESGKSGRVCVSIEKRIPIMAGLGGSSTDGAAVLTGLNSVCGIFSQGRLEEIGAKLGADVPFCIRGGAAFCTGIGEKMTDISPLERCSIILIKPDFSCSTSSAYKLYDEKPLLTSKDPNVIINALRKGDYKTIGDNLYNVFEDLYIVQNCSADINNIKKELIKQGALGSALSGSGSGVFGIFQDENTAQFAFSRLNYKTKFIVKPVFGIEK